MQRMIFKVDDRALIACRIDILFPPPFGSPFIPREYLAPSRGTTSSIPGTDSSRSSMCTVKIPSAENGRGFYRRTSRLCSGERERKSWKGGRKGRQRGANDLALGHGLDIVTEETSSVRHATNR